MNVLEGGPDACTLDKHVTCEPCSSHREDLACKYYSQTQYIKRFSGQEGTKVRNLCKPTRTSPWSVGFLTGESY